MKIRNHRKYEWWFYPHRDSKLRNDYCYIFKYKSDLMRFLNNNFNDSLDGTVSLNENSFGHSGCLREWLVWYNNKQHEHGADIKIDLRQQNFRGRKYIHTPSKISKRSKRYFAFSDKIVNLMCRIEDDNGIILIKDAIKLVELFKKRGFKDFEPNLEDWTYINGHIKDGICFSHWSDRCNWLRTKTIIEYFKREKLISNI